LCIELPCCAEPIKEKWKEVRLRAGYEYDWQTTTNKIQLRSHAFPNVTPLLSMLLPHVFLALTADIS
jgi:hypothetical protein